jgi:hypothetical protein
MGTLSWVATVTMTFAPKTLQKDEILCVLISRMKGDLLEQNTQKMS